MATGLTLRFGLRASEGHAGSGFRPSAEILVRLEGLEPPQVALTDPKSVASTNSAIAASVVVYSGQGGTRQGIRRNPPEAKTKIKFRPVVADHF